MKNTNTGIDCLVQVLQALSDCDCAPHEEGTLTLNQGTHEITVQTDIVPETVYLAVSPVGTPVCVGDIDMVGSTILPNGFVVYADIKSNLAEVSYYAEGKPCG